MKRDIVPYGLRILPELKEMIRVAAKASGRSMNGEIEARLYASFNTRLDLKAISTGDLVRELIDRNDPGRIVIEVMPTSGAPQNQA